LDTLEFVASLFEPGFGLGDFGVLRSHIGGLGRSLHLRQTASGDSDARGGLSQRGFEFGAAFHFGQQLSLADEIALADGQFPNDGSLSRRIRSSDMNDSIARLDAAQATHADGAGRWRSLRRGLGTKGKAEA
jgi:hypothetical protein